MSQRDIRRKARRARRQLTDRQRRHAAAELRRHFSLDLRFRRARSVAAYMAAGGEIDPWPTLMMAADSGKGCYLPIMTDHFRPWQRAPLSFQRFDPRSSLMTVNRYGILEPSLFPASILRPEHLDIILLPLVAFDRRGNRVGMGQGYYDRTLGPVMKRWRRPWLVGCAFSLQEVSQVEVNPWDIALDAIATEDGIIDRAD